MRAFKDNLSDFMSEYNISAEEMSIKFGASAATIYRWLKGTSEPEHLGMANLALQTLRMSYRIVTNPTMMARAKRS